MKIAHSLLSLPLLVATTVLGASCTDDHASFTPAGTGRCDDGVKNGSETDRDCGGVCPPCDDGGVCSDALDCASAFCDDGSCAPCAENDDCTEGTRTLCDAGVCTKPGKDLGEACADGVECKSGFCPAEDGVCCDQACDAECEACLEDKSGADDGTCFAVLVHTDPDTECEATDMTSCAANGQGCNGDAFAAACELWSAGTACGETTCASGTVSGSVCDGDGGCVESSGVSCAPYVCADPASCSQSCAGDEDCADGFFCNQTGACVDKRANGEACAAQNQCASGFCTSDDGICCDVACEDVCQACSASKSGLADGTCGFVSQGTDPDNECLLSCNGNGACSL